MRTREACRGAAIAVALVLAAVSCGGDDESAQVAAVTASSPTIAADAVTTSTGATTSTAPTTSTEPTTSTGSTTTSTTEPEGRAVPARASAGCGSASVAAGEELVTTTSGDVQREYYRHVPPAHDGTTPVPVVLDFHGYSEGATIHLRMSELGPYGDEQGFVTITPQGLGEVARWEASLGSADLAFVSDLLDEVGETLCVDLERIYVAGLSNGAFMTSAIACELADRVAAVAPVAGVRAIEGCEPSRPVPVVAFHGTDDGYVGYDGALGERAANLPAPDGSGRTLGEAGLEVLGELGLEVLDEPVGPSVPEIVAAWAQRNGCDATTSETVIAEDVVLISHDCPPGADAQLYRIEGGGHAWPGSAFSAQVEPLVGRTTFSIDANEVMWAFFQDHPLGGADR